MIVANLVEAVSNSQRLAFRDAEGNVSQCRKQDLLEDGPFSVIRRKVFDKDVRHISADDAVITVEYSRY